MPGHQHAAALRPHAAGRHAPVGLPGAAQRGAVAHERAAARAQVTRGSQLLDLPAATVRGAFPPCNIKEFYGAAGVCVLAERSEGEGGQVRADAALRRPLPVRRSKRPSVNRRRQGGQRAALSTRIGRRPRQWAGLYPERWVRVSGGGSGHDGAQLRAAHRPLLGLLGPGGHRRPVVRAQGAQPRVSTAGRAGGEGREGPRRSLPS